MKNKLLLITLFLTTNAGYCETAARSAVINSAIIKFSLAMAGVIISSIVIFAGLSIYNKFFVKSQKHTTEEEIIHTPKTKEEAIKFFINKNRLK